MKKLVLILVLVSMVSVANAAYVGLNSVLAGPMMWSVNPNPYIMPPMGPEILIGTYAAAFPGMPGAPWAGGVSAGGMNPFVPVPNTAVAPVGPLNTVNSDWTGSHTANAGNLATVIWGGTVWPGWDVTAFDSGGAYVAGDYFLFDLQFGATSAMPLLIDIYDYSVSYTTPAGTITVVPEPVTIALLGLGGLFLARRKK